MPHSPKKLQKKFPLEFSIRIYHFLSIRINLEFYNAGVTELESLEWPLEVLAARDLLQPREDDGVSGAPAAVQQLYLVIVGRADSTQVLGKDPVYWGLVNLDPEEELLPELGAGDVLPGAGDDPEPDPGGGRRVVQDGGGGGGQRHAVRPSHSNTEREILLRDIPTVSWYSLRNDVVSVGDHLGLGLKVAEQLVGLVPCPLDHWVTLDQS